MGAFTLTLAVRHELDEHAERVSFGENWTDALPYIEVPEGACV